MKQLDTHVRQREVAENLASPADPLHENPLADRLLRSRGMVSAAELEFSLQGLPAPALLRDIDLASARIVEAIQLSQKILVVGDYDCDGATSTTLAVLALRAMGATAVDYLLPNRFIHGYGLSPAIVDLAQQCDPHLIITVDNGISSVEGVDSARRCGIDVVVTDHHLPPAKLPEAVALINPNMPGSSFPSANIAGVGVIFFVLAAVRAALTAGGWFVKQSLPQPKLADYLDLVAVGTVADVVPLDSVNRALVVQGIRRIRAGRCRPGITALLKVAGINPQELVTEGIGFGIGPRLNAAGRLDDMRLGVQCLLTDDTAEAMALARQLERQNSERKRIGAEMGSDAAAILAGFSVPEGTQDETNDVMSICLYENNWHEGVTGILAGRLKDMFGAPAVIFAAAKNQQSGDIALKGSARSIDGYHILDALKRVRNKHPAILEKFGGHAKAAGMSLREADFETFKQALDDDVRQFFSNRKPPTQLLTDGKLPLTDFTLANAAMLRELAPWGQDFPAPSFDNRFRVDDFRIMKQRHIKYTLSALPIEQDSAAASASLPVVTALHFNVLEPGEQPAVVPGDIVHAVFELKTNHFNGDTSLQLNLQMLEVLVSASANP